jgi:hypothetical protein
MKVRPKRLLFAGALILTLVGVAVWAVSSFRDGGSTLSVFVSYAKKRIGWAADSSTSDVIIRMAGYAKQGRYDDAVRVGNAWTAKNPNSESNVPIYTLTSRLYLQRTKVDGGHAEEYVRQAMLYRDKALPFESDNVYGLRDLALLSKAGGDLSASQRCVQYRNAIKLLERLGDVLRERRVVAPKEEAFVAPRQGTSAEYVLTVEDIDGMLERTNGTVKRIAEKLHESACQ